MTLDETLDAAWDASRQLFLDRVAAWANEQATVLLQQHAQDVAALQALQQQYDSLSTQLQSTTDSLARAYVDLEAALAQHRVDEARIADLLVQIAALTPFVADTTEPTLDNSGVLAGTRLDPVQGDLTITQPGTILYRKDVFGRVFVKAPDVQIIQSRVRGAGDRTSQVVTYSQALVVAIDAAAVNLRLVQTDLIPDVSHWMVDGIQGHDYYCERVKIRYVTDGFGWFPRVAGDKISSEVWGCFVNDLVFWTGAKGVVHPSDTKTHNDPLQIQGGDGGYVHGNAFHAIFAPKSAGRGTMDYPDYRANAAVQYNNNRGQVTNVRLEKNWLYGGQSAINMGALTVPGQRVGTVIGNRIHRSQRLVGKGILIPMQPSPSTAPLVSVDYRDNVWVDNAAPVAMSRG